MELIEKMEEIKKNIRTWGCGTSRFRVMALFSAGQVFCHKLLYHIVAVITLRRFRIVTHCYTASFSIKTLFCKTNNIFYSLENPIWDKTKQWCMETRLHNISKTTNVTDLIKTILKSSCRVLLDTCNLTASTRPDWCFC